jgi:hypothetical protein
MKGDEGGCLCGDVRYRINGTALSRGICHCRTCRRASGAPSVAWVTFRSNEVSFIAGEPATFRSSPAVSRTFCTRCGTPLTYRHDSDPDTIDITTVSLDDPERFVPEREIWTEHKLSWEALNADLPHYPRTRSEAGA